MKINFTVVYIVYYVFAGFLLFGIYHIIFVLHESKWWLLLLMLLSVAPSYSKKSNNE